MSTLKVDKITGITGIGGDSSPISIEGDTATLGASVTVPAAGVTGTLGGSVVIPAAGVSGTLGSGVTLDSGITGIPAAGITGTLGSGVFPSGHVLQVEQYTSTASHATSSSHNTWRATSILKAVTPKITTSRFLVELSAIGSAAGDTWHRTGMKATGSSIVDTAFGVDDATPLSRSSGLVLNDTIVRITWNIIVDMNQSNITDTITFTVWMNTGTSGTQGFLGSRSGAVNTEAWTFLTVTEIA